MVDSTAIGLKHIGQSSLPKSSSFQDECDVTSGTGLACTHLIILDTQFAHTDSPIGLIPHCRFVNSLERSIQTLPITSIENHHHVRKIIVKAAIELDHAMQQRSQDKEVNSEDENAGRSPM
jgi:hypothetical protein